MPLTYKQQATLEALRNKTYGDIKLRDLTSAVNAAFAKKESRELKKELIKGTIDWYIDSPTKKVKDPSLINKIIVSKIKTKDSKNEEREIFSEINKDMGGADEEEEKHLSRIKNL